MRARGKNAWDREIRQCLIAALITCDSATEDWSKDTLEQSLGLLLLQPSMERDKKLCKASIDAQARGHAASTLAQPIGMD